MQITVLRSKLVRALKDARAAVARNPQLPILSSFLLETRDGRLIISATDLYLGIRSSVRGSDVEPGRVAAPAQVLYDLISSIPGEQVTLEAEDSHIRITTDDTDAQLQVLPADEFPQFPDPGEKEIKLDFETFDDILSQVAFAASSDETRPVLTGVLLNLGKESEVVATDGFRLARRRLQAEFENLQLLVPANALREVHKIAAGRSVESVKLAIDTENKQLYASFEDVEVHIRLLEGDYPPYNRIIPESVATTVQLDAKELEQHLKSLQVFARDSSNVVHMSMDETSGTVSLSASSPSLGTQKTSLQTEEQTGPPVEIAFNIDYLKDMLSAVKPDTITIGMNDSLQPASIHPDGEDRLTYVVMPFKLNQ